MIFFCMGMVEKNIGGGCEVCVILWWKNIEGVKIVLFYVGKYNFYVICVIILIYLFNVFFSF